MGSLLRLSVAIFVGIVIGVGAIFALGPSIPLPAFSRPQAEIRPPSIPVVLPQSSGGSALPVGPTDASAVYDMVSPGVVNINTSGQGRDALGRTFRQQGTGSGFIIDTEGHIATNQHVVSGAQRMDITLADGSSYVGEVVASDPANDLTIVKLQAPVEKLRSLTVVKLGDSSQMRVGQPVVAIGNPFGLERSISLGIVSSLGRTRPGLEQRLITNMIQTDAAINPGNSGGPLLNLQGEVIGINEQIQADGVAQGNVGIGFAIPVNTLKRYLPELQAGREPKHAWLGIAGGALSPSAAERARLLSAQGTPLQGVLLASVSPNGPAAQAGLRGSPRNDTAGDIITELDGQPVRSVEDIAAYIDRKEPGDNLKVTYMRGGQTQTADVVLGTWENSSPSQAR